MIAHYTIHAEPVMLSNQWSVKMDSDYRPTYNAQPTQKLPVITNTESDRLSFMHWGVIPDMARKKSVSPKLLAVDLEELKSKQIHQSNLLKARCLIPMHGYYWDRPIGKKKRSPMYTFLNNHEPLAVAGLWGQFDDFDGNVHFTFKLITQRAPSAYRELGNEIPLVLKNDLQMDWLSSSKSYDDLIARLSLPELPTTGSYAVSPRVLDLACDDENLIKSTNPTDQHGNYTLFD